MGKQSPKGYLVKKNPLPILFFLGRDNRKILGYRAQHLTMVTLWVKAGGGESLSL